MDRILQPHQLRVVEESDQLITRIEALNKFLGTPLFQMQTLEEQARLQKQYRTMHEYADVLMARIQAFPE